jgi:hypothetical protein
MDDVRTTAKAIVLIGLLRGMVRGCALGVLPGQRRCVQGRQVNIVRATESWHTNVEHRPEKQKKRHAFEQVATHLTNSKLTFEKRS